MPQTINIPTRFVLLALLIAGSLTTLALTLPENTQPEKEAAPVYEIRSYYLQEDQVDNYREWISTHGLPHIRKHLDVVGFWIQGEHEAQISGVEMDDLGPANVTWVIRWSSREARDEGMSKTFGTPEWQEIFAKFPGGREAYVRTEVRYFDEL